MSSRLAAALAGAFVGGVLSGPATAGDWTMYRGTKQDGKQSEKFTGKSLTKLWTAKVGDGFSTVSVSKGKVYTMGNDGKQDTVYCLDEKTGKVVWKHSYPCVAGNHKGPRATPTVDGSTVYFVSRAGDVGALTTSGKKIWQKNVAKEIGAKMPQWGYAGSAVVSGKLLLVNIGTAGTGLDKATGEVVWKTGTKAAGYATPVLATLGGKSTALVFAAKALVGVSPTSGGILFAYPWATKYDVNAADPIVSGSNVFISSNYNAGCAMLKLAGGKATKVWQNKSMRNHFNSCVLVDGYLYGNDEGTLRCLDAKTGREKWSKSGVEKGGLMYSDGKLIGLTGKGGELYIAKASSASFQEIARKKVLNGPRCWTHPVLANGKLFCRDYDGDLVCLSAN